MGLAAAEAAAIYLKNGRVMQGKIVEKSEKYLVLKSGEGEDAVKVTVFTDDINRIESQEDYARQTDLIPFDLVGASGPVSSDAGSSDEDADPLSPPEGDGLELLKQSAQEEGMIVSSQPAPSVGGTFAWPKPPSGTISGSVVLPDVFAKTRGDLYVFVVKNIGGGQFVHTRPAYYQRIRSADIADQVVPFKIEGIPPGEYKVVGYWDVRLPQVEEAVYSQGFVLRKLGSRGDYFGRSKDPLAVGMGQNIADVVVDCNRRLKATAWPSRLPQEGSDIVIEDLLYQRVSAEDQRFTLILRNVSDYPTADFTLSVFINGQEVKPPVDGVCIRAGDKGEISLTRAYNDFADDFRADNRGAEPPADLDFKVIWPPTKEVIFEKKIVIFK